MSAHHHGARLVAVRSEDASGRLALRLIGELDLSTLEVLDAHLGDTREQNPPNVIDISELRFLDLTGLRALRRAGHRDDSLDTPLVGATGIVRRLIELESMLEAKLTGALIPLLAREPTTPRAVARDVEAILSSGRSPVTAGLPAASSTPSTTPAPAPAAR